MWKNSGMLSPVVLSAVCHCDVFFLRLTPKSRLVMFGVNIHCVGLAGYAQV